jgi:D-tagatose-1,6-bisphosphate aldolase subunit GatZ/KbaZ
MAYTNRAMQFFFGPMTKNVVDAVLSYTKSPRFIPSRRQVEWNGGYTGWTTQEFRSYVGPDAIIERDHGGPGQGTEDDDGYASLEVDCMFCDILHIDPWKKYPAYKEGLEHTIAALEFCYARNPALEYEVGTEESIRPFRVQELRQFLTDLRSRLAPALWDRIKYVVIQCGTELQERSNIGEFDPQRLVDMLEVVASFGKTAKEHNGDWVPLDVLHKKQALGLTCINIAPQLGELESRVLWGLFTEEDQEAFYQLCLASRKWEKWVSSSFDPSLHREALVLICGHYVVASPKLQTIKAKYSGIDSVIQAAIGDWLRSLV